MDEDASGELSVSELYRILKRYKEESGKKRALEGDTVDMSVDHGHTFLKIEDYGFSPGIVKPIKMPPPPPSRRNSQEEVTPDPVSKKSSPSKMNSSPSKGTAGKGNKSSTSTTSNVKTYRIFGKRAFQETLLKMTFYHLLQNGNSLQKSASTYVKALWLIGYIRAEFQKYYSKIDDIIAEAVRQDEKLRVLLEKNEIQMALKAQDEAPIVEQSSKNILFSEALGKVQQQQRAEKLFDQGTAERLLRLQKLICATKTSYVSPLTRLLRQRWDPFESVEVVNFESKDAWSTRCPYCFEIPKRTCGGYSANITCLGCSPLIMDVRRSMADLPLWEAVRPFTWQDELRVTGEKRRYRLVLGTKRPPKVQTFDG